LKSEDGDGRVLRRRTRNLKGGGDKKMKNAIVFGGPRIHQKHEVVHTPEGNINLPQQSESKGKRARAVIRGS